VIVALGGGASSLIQKRLLPSWFVNPEQASGAHRATRARLNDPCFLRFSQEPKAESRKSVPHVIRGIRYSPRLCASAVNTKPTRERSATHADHQLRREAVRGRRRRAAEAGAPFCVSAAYDPADKASPRSPQLLAGRNGAQDRAGETVIGSPALNTRNRRTLKSPT
jgi:hypothetical protein